MAETVIPEWVAAPPREMADLHWLAWREVRDTRSPHALGVESVLTWIGGFRVAPVTGHTVTPITLRHAETEFRAAGAVLEPTGALWGLVARELGVDSWVPPNSDPQWTKAVYRTLKWLIGGQTSDVPMDVPVRHADGSIPSAEELYAIALQVQPDLFALPEQRVELRLRAERNAARYRRLAALIDDTSRQG